MKYIKLMLILSLLVPVVLASSSIKYNYELLISDYDGSVYKFPVFPEEDGMTTVKAVICDGGVCHGYKHYQIITWVEPAR